MTNRECITIIVGGMVLAEVSGVGLSVRLVNMVEGIGTVEFKRTTIEDAFKINPPDVDPRIMKF